MKKVMLIKNKKIKVLAVASIALLSLVVLDYFSWYKIPADCGTVETINATAFDTSVKVSKDDYAKITSCFTKRFGGLRSTRISVETRLERSANTYVFIYKGGIMSGLSDSFNEFGSGKYAFPCTSFQKLQDSVTFTCQNENLKYTISSI